MPRYRSHGSRRGPSREESLQDLTETASNAIGAIISNKVFSQPKQQQQQSRSMLTDQNRSGNLANTRLTFRHKPNYMSPAEKTKLASIERGDQVYERISKREEVPTWLETIAKAPAQESRKALFRHETAEEEEELQPEYVPPHLDPISSNIVDNSFWKQNPRRGHGLAEAQPKKRIVVPSSELPTIRDIHRPDQTPKGYKREAEEDADVYRKSKRHKRNKRYRTPSSSEDEDDEEAATSRSYLQKESATIRDQPGIVAGGAAVIRSPDRVRTHSHVQSIQARASQRPISLEHFRYQAVPIRATPLPSMSNPHFQTSVAHQASPGFISPSFRAVPLVKPTPYRPPVTHRVNASHTYPRMSQQATPLIHHPQMNQVFANKMAQAVPNFRTNEQSYQATGSGSTEVPSQHPQGGITASLQLQSPSSEPAAAVSSTFVQPITSVRPAHPPLNGQTPSSPFSRVVRQAGAMAQRSNQSLSRAVQAMFAGSHQQPSLHRAMLQTTITRSTANPIHPFGMIDQQPQRIQYVAIPASIAAGEVENVRPSIEKHDIEYFESLLDDDFGEVDEQRPNLNTVFSQSQAYPVLPKQSALHKQDGQESALFANQYANGANEQNPTVKRPKAQRIASAQTTPPHHFSKRPSREASSHQSKPVTPRTTSHQVSHNAAIAPMPLPGPVSSKFAPKKRVLAPPEPRQTRSATLAASASAHASAKKERASSSSHRYSDSLEDGGRTNTPATSDAGLTFGGKKFSFDTSKISFG